MKELSFKITLENYKLLNNQVMLLPLKANFKMLLIILILYFIEFIVLSNIIPIFNYSDGYLSSINITNVLIVLVESSIGLVVFLFFIFIRRQNELCTVYEKYLYDAEYKITVDDDYFEVNIGDKLINKYSWDNVKAILQTKDYYLIEVSISSNRFSFFPKSDQSSKKLKDFIETKILQSN